jgi:hypothetical protein
MENSPFRIMIMPCPLHRDKFSGMGLPSKAGILAIALCAFVLAALFAERRQHEQELMESEARL